jgi:3-oxoacyl-[acyl-carrier protein] reductase
MEFEGKIAIVTGAGRGIGAAIAEKFFLEGANVAMVDYNPGEVKGREGSKNKTIIVQSDVASFADSQRVVNEVLKTFGAVHILVCNAGINRDSVIWKMEEEQWNTVIETNLKGCFNYIRAVAPIFKGQNYGKIVSISSINGLRGKFGQANYAASKAGMIGLVKSVAQELGKYNVNVNAIAPGLIETDMVKNAPDSVKEAALKETVLGRIGMPEDVAYTVAFLCSERARHITGEVIRVDGGQYI